MRLRGSRGQGGRVRVNSETKDSVWIENHGAVRVRVRFRGPMGVNVADQRVQARGNQGRG